jgi:uncharacterized Zn-finger protein
MKNKSYIIFYMFTCICNFVNSMDIIPNKSFIQYECDKCGKILTTLGGFKTHKKGHLEIKPYSCNLCHRQFVQKFHLINHVKKHNGEKPLKKYKREKLHECNICAQKFYTKGSLEVHKKIHKIQQPHTCNICAKVFSTQKGLNIHANVHKTYIENIATPIPNIEEYFPITLLLNTNNFDNELSPDWIEHL